MSVTGPFYVRSMTPTLIAGEPVDVLIEALQQVELQPTRNGMSSMSMRLAPRLAAPFLRALMRVEAELLLDDADRLATEDQEDRSHEQRAADAFVALALRVSGASHPT